MAADGLETSDSTHDNKTMTPSITIHEEPELVDSPTASPSTEKDSPLLDGEDSTARSSKRSPSASSNDLTASPELTSSAFVPSASPEALDKAASLRTPASARQGKPRSAATTPLNAMNDLSRGVQGLGLEEASAEAGSSRQGQSYSKEDRGGRSGSGPHESLPSQGKNNNNNNQNNDFNPTAQRAQELGTTLSPARGTTLGAYGAPGSGTKGSNPMSRTSSFEYRETLDAKTRDLEDGSRIINQYRLCNMIGQGAYGCVYRAVLQNDSSVEVAVKEFGKTRLRKYKRQEDMRKPSRGGLRGRGLFGARGGRPGQGQREMPPVSSGQQVGNEAKGQQDPRGKEKEAEDPLSLIRHEIAILKKLHHPHLVQLYEVLDDPSRDSLYMVFEFCPNGPIIDVKLHQQSEPLREIQASRYFVQMMLGVEYLHYHGIVHRDLKPDNILLLKEKDKCKIVDFGVSEFFFKPGDDTMRKSAGSPAFMSPELCKAGHGDFHGKQSDVWSLGVTLYCMVVGRLPFDKEHFLDLYEAILHTEPRYPDHLSKDCVNLLQSLLCKEPKDRISVEEMRKHPWVLQGGENTITPSEENIKDVVEEVTQEELDKAIIKIASVFTFARAISKFKRAGSRGTSIGSISDTGSSVSGKPSKAGSRTASSSTIPISEEAQSEQNEDDAATGKGGALDGESVGQHEKGESVDGKGQQNEMSAVQTGRVYAPSSTQQKMETESQFSREPEIETVHDGKDSQDGSASKEATMRDDQGNLKTKILAEFPTVKSPSLANVSLVDEPESSYFGEQQKGE